MKSVVNIEQPAGVYSIRIMNTLFLCLLLAFSILFAGHTWEHFFHHPGKLWGSLAALAFGLLDILLLLALPRLGLSFGAIGMPLFLAITGRLTLTIIPALFKRWNPRLSLGMWLILNGLMSGVIFYSLYIEPFNLGITRLAISEHSLRGGSAQREVAPLHILHLSDLHIERITQREREMVAEVAALAPDLLLLTGDYLNLDYVNDPRARRDARAVLADLAALPIPYGVYAVNGTVDTPEIMAELFEGLNIHVLDDTVAIVGARQPSGSGPQTGVARGATSEVVAIVGITDHHNQAEASAVLASLAARLPTDSARILLYHTPDLIESAAQNEIDLYLAGHTHGGQIRLPGYGALVTFSAYGKQYEMGQYQVGGTTLYVSRGLGMEGFGMPRARFLCPPEIVAIELR